MNVQRVDERVQVEGDERTNQIELGASRVTGRLMLKVTGDYVAPTRPCRPVRQQGTVRLMRAVAACDWAPKLVVKTNGAGDHVRFISNFPATSSPALDRGPPELPPVAVVVDGGAGADLLEVPDGSLALGGTGDDSIKVSGPTVPPGVEGPFPEAEADPNGMHFRYRCHRSWLFGEGGNDSVVGSACSETIVGGLGHDLIAPKSTGRSQRGQLLGLGDEVFADERKTPDGNYDGITGLFKRNGLLGWAAEQDEISCAGGHDALSPTLIVDPEDQMDKPASGCELAARRNIDEPISFNRWPEDWPHLFEQLYPNLNRP